MIHNVTTYSPHARAPVTRAQKIRLSIDEAITLGQLEHGLRRVGEGYFKWELCAQYAIIGQFTFGALCVASGIPLSSIALPGLFGILLWSAVAVWFHVARGRLWMPESWTLSALTVKAFAVPADLIAKSKPGGSVQWSVARRWLAEWKASVEVPSLDEIRSAPIADRKSKRRP